jgi:hypothetical protein
MGYISNAKEAIIFSAYLFDRPEKHTKILHKCLWQFRKYSTKIYEF